MEDVLETVGAYAMHFFAKCVHLILAARLQHPEVVHDAEKDEWFGLPIGEVASVREVLEDWKKTPRIPLLLKIFVRDSNLSPQTRGVETWRLEYRQEVSPPVDTNRSYRDDACALYKNMTVTTRALYSYLRLLPGQRLAKRALADESSGLSIDYEIEPETENATDLTLWKLAVSMHTLGGQLSIHVLTADISDILPEPLQLPNAQVAPWVSSRIIERSQAADSTSSWVEFRRKEDCDSKQPIQNQVTEHFKASYESVKSVVSTLVGQRTLKKALSFPRSRRNLRVEPASEESRIYEFVTYLKSTSPLGWETSGESVNFALGRALLSECRQKFNGRHPAEEV